MQLRDKRGGIDLLRNRRQDDELEPVIGLEPRSEGWLHVVKIDETSAPPHEPREPLGSISGDLAEHRASALVIQCVRRPLEQLATETSVSRGRRDDHVRHEPGHALRVELVRDAAQDVVAVERDARVEGIAPWVQPGLERLALCGERVEVDPAVESLEQRAIRLDDPQRSSSGGGVG